MHRLPVLKLYVFGVFFSVALPQTVELASNNKSDLINNHLPNIKLKKRNAYLLTT